MEHEHILTTMIVSALGWSLGATANIFLRGKTQLRASLWYAGISLLVLVGTLSLSALATPGKNSLASPLTI